MIEEKLRAIGRGLKLCFQASDGCHHDSLDECFAGHMAAVRELMLEVLDEEFDLMHPSRPVPWERKAADVQALRARLAALPDKEAPRD